MTYTTTIATLTTSLKMELRCLEYDSSCNISELYLCNVLNYFIVIQEKIRK